MSILLRGACATGVAWAVLSGCGQSNNNPPAPAIHVPTSSDVRVAVGDSGSEQTGDLWEAETSTAYDPQSSRSYVATVQAVIREDEDTGRRCIVGKGLRLYQGDRGAGYRPVTDGMEDLEPVAGTWYTDPWVTVAGGSVYLVYLHAGIGDRGIDPVDFAVPCGSERPEEQDRISRLRWFNPTETGLVFGGEVDVAGDVLEQDHLRMAGAPNRVVVAVSQPPTIATFTRSEDGSLSEVAVQPPVNTQDGRLPRYLDTVFGVESSGTLNQDELYVAHHTPPVGGDETYGVQRYTWSAGGWSLADQGGPEAPADPAGVFGFVPFTGGAQNARIVATLPPALNVAQLPGDPEPTVFLAANIGQSTGRLRVRLTQAPASQISDPGMWTVLPIDDDAPLIDWNPTISVDPVHNVLDVSTLRINLPPGQADPDLNSTVVPYVTRYYPANNLGSPDLLVFSEPLTMRPMRILDLPERISLTVVGGEDSFTYWPGDYQGVVAQGELSLLAWPELPAAATPGSDPILSDVGLGYQETRHGSVHTLSLPDTIWQCDCLCPAIGAVRTKVGCVDGNVSDLATACASVCQGGICGLATTCAPGPEPGCTPAAELNGAALMGAACAVEAGRGPGPAVADYGDYFITESGGSGASIDLDVGNGNPSVGGNFSLNVGSGVPEAGAQIEIARANFSVSSFHVGGLLGGDVQSINLKHIDRMYGSFVDATNFMIPAEEARFALRLRVNPDGPSWLTGDTTTHRFLVTNDEPILGSLDVSTGQFQLQFSAGDGGESINLTFNGVIGAFPVDSDEDGVPDAIDNCPEVFNPDQTDDPPVFGALNDSVVSLCTPGDPVVLVPPDVSDACTPNEVTLEAVVTTINGEPAHPTDPGIYLEDFQGTLPSEGTLTVEWTAADGNGNESVIQQIVEVVAQPTLFARGMLKLDDGVDVIAGFGDYGTLANSGSPQTFVGASASVGDILSEASVLLNSGSTVNGFVRSQGIVEQQDPSVSVTGPILEHTSSLFAEFLEPDIDFPALVDDVLLEPEQPPVPLAPGPYRHVKVERDSSIQLQGVPGGSDYFFDTLQLEPGSTVVLDKSQGPINVYVRSTFKFAGSFVEPNGDYDDFVVAYFGADTLFVETPFTGVITAPNAKLNLSTQGPGHTGLFYAHDIEVHPHTNVWHVPFNCEPSVSPLPSCEDGVHNGAETDVDCGGQCAGCALGQSCTMSTDCASQACSGGVCVAVNPCTEATAVDLGSDGNAVTTPTDGCLMIRDGYPSWWETRNLQLQNFDGSDYPVPHEWQNACAASSGMGVFTGDWQSQILGPANSDCATLVRLLGSGEGTITLRYYAN